MLLTLLNLYVFCITIIAIKLMVKTYLQLKEQKIEKFKNISMIFIIMSMIFLLVFLFIHIIQVLNKGGC